MLVRHPYVLLRCDACGLLVDACARSSARSDRRAAELVQDEDLGPAGSGLLVFTRAGEAHYEEPPLCARCSVAIGVTALVRWAEEEEEG